jgi:hypothetical protein
MLRSSGTGIEGPSWKRRCGGHATFIAMGDSIPELANMQR